jgi:hypothetical protein
VCHQPHDTFSGWYVSTGTLQGTFLSTESPRPSCRGKLKYQKLLQFLFFFFVSPVWKRELRDNPPGRTCSIPSRRPRLHLQKFCYTPQMPGTLYSPKRRGALWYNCRSFQQNGELKSTSYYSTVSSSTRNSSGVLIFQACGIYQFRNSLH